MKKFMLSAVVLFAAVAGYNCYNNSSAADDELSELAKANLEALANVNLEQPCYLNNKSWYCEPKNDGIMCYCGLDYGEL
ncbi:MAG: NVEALA domain-containing protein [Bacteroidaceae bacterium]|nr:NVEALA domain-containing protein [Bacteroidaceae bacterium]